MEITEKIELHNKAGKELAKHIVNSKDDRLRNLWNYYCDCLAPVLDNIVKRLKASEGDSIGLSSDVSGNEVVLSISELIESLGRPTIGRDFRIWHDGGEWMVSRDGEDGVVPLTIWLRKGND